MDWTTDIENLLEQIRQNSVNLSTNHKKNYFFYNEQFDVCLYRTLELAAGPDLTAMLILSVISSLGSEINNVSI